MTELQDIEHELASLTEQLTRLRKRAAEIRKKQQLAYFEGIRNKITRIHMSIESLRVEGKVRADVPQASR